MQHWLLGGICLLLSAIVIVLVIIAKGAADVITSAGMRLRAQSDGGGGRATHELLSTYPIAELELSSVDGASALPDSDPRR